MTRPPHPVPDFQTRFFAATNDGFALQPWVRQCVRFHRANIFEEDFLAGSAPYDFVFCRNLLIYFDRATQAKALNKLGRLLMPPQPPQAGCECERATSDERGHCPQCGGGPGGVLFVGPAELPLATAHGFISANIPLAFACRKAGEPHTPRRKVECHDTAGSRSAHAGLVNAIPSQTPPQPGALPFGEASRAGSPGAEPPAERNLPDLALAHQLADAGKLNEAAAVCHAHLDLHGPSAQAYYLLGLICDAGGDPAKPDGMDYYRKALYLDPNHYETLLHMALLLEKNPATRHEARTLRRRAGRVQPAPVAALGSARTGPKP